MLGLNLFKILLLCIIIPNQVFGFYYYGVSGDRKCFNKELSKNTLLKGKYVIQTYDEEMKAYREANPQNFGITVEVEEVFDDNHKVVHQKGSPIGDFTFVALDSGEHRICLEATDSKWLGKTKTKVSIEFEIGSEAQLDSKQKKTVQSLHQKIKILNNKLEYIRSEQSLVRDREAIFRDVSEAVNSKAMWWSILQLIALGSVCAWQMKHLRSFFVKQKVL